MYVSVVCMYVCVVFAHVVCVCTCAHVRACVCVHMCACACVLIYAVLEIVVGHWTFSDQNCSLSEQFY